MLHLLMPQSRGLVSPAPDSHSSWPPVSFPLSVLLVPISIPTVTQSPLIHLWICLKKWTELTSVITNYQDAFCRCGTLMSGAETKVQKCVWVSLLGWDVEISSSPLGLEKFTNQRGIWWFVQAYGRMRLAPFSWRPLWGGLQQAIHKRRWSAFLSTWELE